MPAEVPTKAQSKPGEDQEDKDRKGDPSRVDSESTGMYGADGVAMKAIVTPTMKGQNMSWLHDNFGDEWEINEYVVDDPDAKNSVVKNKGNEAGVYLTYSKSPLSVCSVLPPAFCTSCAP